MPKKQKYKFYKIYLSIILGLIGFVVNFFPTHIPIPPNTINFQLGLIFPLLVAIAWGWKYGLLSATLGLACQSGWWLWGNRGGWVILASVPPYTLWVVWHGWFAEKWKRSHQLIFNKYVVEIPIRIINLAILFFLGRWLAQFNPAPWAPHFTSTNFPVQFFKATIIQQVFNAYLALIVVDLLLYTKTIRKLLKLKIASFHQTSGLIMSAAVIVGLLFWLLDSILYFTSFSKGQASFLEILIADVSLYDSYVRFIVFLFSVMGGLVFTKFFQKRTKEQAKFKVITESTKDIVTILEYKHPGQIYFKYLSSAAKEVLGLVPREFIGKRARFYVHYDDHPIVDKALKKIFKNKDKIAFLPEIRVKHKSGKWVPIEGYVRNMIDDPSIQGIVGDFRDLRKRKKAEKTLQQSESKYKTLFENMSSAFAFHKIITDKKGKPINYRYIEVNDAFREFTGLKGKIIGKTVKELIPGIEKDVFDWIGIFGKIAQTGKSIIIEDQYSVSLDRWYTVTGFSPKKNYFAVTFTETTARMKAMEAVKKSEKSMRQAQQVAKLGSWEWDLKNKLIFSDEMFNILEMKKTADNAVSKKVAGSLVSPQMRKQIKEITRPAMKTQSSFNIETQVHLKTGQTKDLRVMGEAMLDDKGKPYKLVGIGQDVTERKQARRERAALEAKVRHQQKLESIGTLASGVAHEINNPLMGVINYAQLIKDKIKDKSLAKFASGIIDESNRMSRIVRNLLSFARQERENHSPAKMKDIIEASLSLLRTTFNRDQITLQIEIPKNVPKIKCRSQQIQQVIMNLLTNARDALNEKYKGYHKNKIIKISVKPFTKDGVKWVRTTVEDHGVGIPKENLERVFDPFFTTKAKDVGTGLGLSVSYGIVKEHQGEISVESELGQYSKVHVNLMVNNGWLVKKKNANDDEER